MSAKGREQQAGISALSKCCGTAFGKEGSNRTFVAASMKVRFGPEVTALTRGAVCRHSLHLQTKWARPKKADAQGHDPVFFGGASAAKVGSEPFLLIFCIVANGSIRIEVKTLPSDHR